MIPSLKFSWEAPFILEPPSSITREGVEFLSDGSRCAPNCVVTFDGVRVFVRTIEQVSEGTELCFSYVDINDPSPVRKAALKKDYFFDCDCPKCQLPEAALLLGR